MTTDNATSSGRRRARSKTKDQQELGYMGAFLKAIRVDASPYRQRSGLVAWAEDEDDLKKLNRAKLFEGVSPEVRQSIEADLAFLDEEVMPAYNRHSSAAKAAKANYLGLQKDFAYAAAATIFISAVQAGVIANVNAWLAVLIVGLAQSFLAFLTTWIAGRLRIRDPFKIWVSSRRKVEALRREYFRYLMKLEPYDKDSPEQRARRKDMLIAIVTDIDTEPDPDADNSAAGSG